MDYLFALLLVFWSAVADLSPPTVLVEPGTTVLPVLPGEWGSAAWADFTVAFSLVSPAPTAGVWAWAKAASGLIASAVAKMK